MLNVEYKLMQQIAPNQTYEALPHAHKLGEYNVIFSFYFIFELFRHYLIFVHMFTSFHAIIF